jgi:Domain of unknown function (DUF4082)/HYDIN/CFA65/VesB-like, Ig-like domain
MKTTHRYSATLFLSCLVLALLALNSVSALLGADLGGGAGVIGNDSDGTFSRNIDAAQIHGNRFRAPVNMRLTDLRARVLELTGTFKCAVYSDTAGLADRLLASSVAVVNATNGWNTFPLMAPLDVVGGDFYWLVIWADTAGARVVADNVGTYSLGAYSYATLAGEFPDPISLTVGTGDSPERTYCIYSEGLPIGTATGPEMDLRGNGKLIVSGDVSPSAQDGTDFGSTNVGSGFQDSTFTIQNVGDAPLALTGTPRVSVTGPAAVDFIVTSPTNSSIAPGGTATFTVRFDPSARGLRTATISIPNNDSTENPYTFMVQGGGVAAGRESIFPDTKVLGDVNFDGTYYELGTVFRASVAGKITHLRVYSLASESGDHTARLWRNSDNTVIGGPYTWNYGGVTGWIEFDILDVDIAADTDYTVSISTGTSPLKNYPNLSDLAAGGNNGLHLSYPVDAGKFTTTRDARPTSSFNHGDYGRDVLFVPSAPPPESLFPDTKVLGDVNFDGTYYELGTVFRASVAGKITHLRVYSLASESGDHTARLWRNSDNTVIGGPYIWNYGGVTGWIEFDILDVDIAADTDYTISISTGTSPLKNYPNLSDMAAGGNNGMHLSYPVDAGKFIETKDARPTSSFNHGDYGRDVVFISGTDAGDITYSFAEITEDFFIINGIHGGIDFGTGEWFGFLSQAGLSQAGSLSSSPGVFILPAGKVLKAIRLSSTLGGVWRISDGVNPDRSGTFAASDTPVFVLTDWQLPASTVTVELDGYIDDIVYSDPPPVIAPLRVTEIRADQATGNVTLRWEGGEDRFQVFKATSVEGPFLPASGLLSSPEFTDVGALRGPEPCTAVSSGGGGVNRPFSTQTGAFTAQFDATPSAAPIDCVMALSSGPQTTFGGFACLARFNTDGNIDARNGGIYTAASVIPYTANVKYSFRLAVDIPAHRYSVYVTPAGAVEQAVGVDFAFRSEQSAVANLNNWGVIMSSPTGTNTVCNFTDGVASPGTSQSFYRVRRL